MTYFAKCVSTSEPSLKVVLDGVIGVFYAPQPTTPGDWVLNTSTYLWENVAP